jgi:hypothetical protein
MTDDDVLDEPLTTERFGPPQPAPRPSLFERLRDRLATRRALSRSSSAYDDSVQIVSGSGAPLRPGRARLEVVRRRQEALRGEGMQVQGEPVQSRFAMPVAGDAADPGIDPELGLGPLPDAMSPLGGGATPMPRVPAPPPLPAAAGMPPPKPRMEMPPLPPRRPGDPITPISGATMPPPRHTLGSTLGELPPPRLPGQPPASLPPRPIPDPLGEALSEFDRAAAAPGAVGEPRAWRPREVSQDAAAAPPRRFAGAAPSVRPGPSPVQLREGRRLLALFGAAALLMLVVGVASGRTTSPLPSSSSSARSAPPPRPAAQPSQPAARTSSPPTQLTVGPSAQSSQPAAPPAGTLTGTKVLGDGGTGFQIKDFRYGVHPNDFRIVLDMEGAGGSSPAPKVTIGFLDSTTLVIALDGVVPAGSTGQLPSGNPVVSVTLMQSSPVPGATAYQVKLAHPVTFGAFYALSPLRLVLDLAG